MLILTVQCSLMFAVQFNMDYTLMLGDNRRTIGYFSAAAALVLHHVDVFRVYLVICAIVTAWVVLNAARKYSLWFTLFTPTFAVFFDTEVCVRPFL